MRSKKNCTFCFEEKSFFDLGGETWVDRAVRRAMFLLPGKAGIFLKSSDGALDSPVECRVFFLNEPSLIVELGKTLPITTRKAWRTWLEKNHASKKEIWLVYPLRHTGRRRLPYNDAVEEALCFGWIDSTVKKMDADRMAQRFSPRRSAKSEFLETNKERVRRLIRAGLMTPAGLAKIQTRLDESFAIPADILRALKKDATAWKNFQALPEWYQRVRIGWIEATRQQGRLETFQTRLAYFLKMTAQNKRFGMVK